MVTEDQSEVIAFLGASATHAGAAVDRIETHASIVFLAGTRAWKLKRAVLYDYLDFSTAERRRVMCEAEVRINRRTAPGLYRGTVPITRQPDGSLALGGSGAPVDWAIEMVRFDQDGLFDRLAARGELDLELMAPLASNIARFHLSAERRQDHGGKPGMAWVIDGNAAGFADQGPGILDPTACAELTRRAREALERHACRLDSRRASGFVRQCHGDLHLRNIVLIDGRPTLFDAIEFNDEISCIDVLYDVAFLFMDLWRRDLPRHANAVWNGYLAETTDYEGIPVMPLFLSCRAAVRAKTSATSANLQTDEQRRTELQEMARGYVTLAQELLRPPAPCLIAIGGFSGSGKSTLARALGALVGPVPGAVVIRSDEIRKRLFGVEPLHRLGPEAYGPDVTRHVYATVTERAHIVVRGGHAAIADAVFARPEDREAIEHTARMAGVPFVGLWLDAPEPALIARIEARTLDASDAGAEVIRQQVAQDTGRIVWHRIDASSPFEQVLENATRTLHARLEGGGSLARWQHFSHDADIGLVGIGPTKAEAFRQAAIALTAVVTSPEQVNAVTPVELVCGAPDDELLLIEWLNALIYEMSVRAMLFANFAVDIHDHELRATAWGESVDVDRHEPAVEIKGATMTAVQVAPVPGGWRAQCVVDV